MNQPHSQTSGYRSEIDGLRAFSIVSVVIFHAFPNLLSGGFIGVDVFFVISGFLITGHILGNLQNNKFSFIDFFKRRIRRIFPALILVMVSTLAFGWFTLLADEYSQLGKHIASGAVFISNFVFASEVGYFDSASELKPMLHLWSLAVEEQFYIVTPLFLWLGWKARLNPITLIIGLLILSFSMNIWFVNTHPTETFFWPFSRFWELLLGSLLAWIMLHRHPLSHHNIYTCLARPAMTQLLKRLHQNGAFTFLGLILLFISVFTIHKTDPFPSYVALMPTMGALLIIIGGGQNIFTKIILTNRVAIWFGLISYPLYLWHWPILSYLHIIEDGTPETIARIIAVLCAIPLAWATYRFIETPIRFGKKSKEPLISITLVASVALVGFIGYSTSVTDFRNTKTVTNIAFRQGLEHKIGQSYRWFEGQENWLFLGNAHDRTIEKLKMATPPDSDDIAKLHAMLTEIASVAEQSNTQLALLIGPNKSSVYLQYLPPDINVSSGRYVDFFLEPLRNIPNLTVYNPTQNFIDLPKSEGLVYYRTDTHWNEKGAFIAFKNLMAQLSLSSPNVDFSLHKTKAGDLVEMSALPDFPLMDDDNWVANIQHEYELTQKQKENTAVSDSFGAEEVVTNTNPIINKTVWIIGDSFTKAIKPYINATFAEVRYLGHWHRQLPVLSSRLQESKNKPDAIIIVRVERSF